MAVHVSHASLPYPIKNARYSFLVPFLDADGDPTDPTTPDTELSQDNGAFADAAEEVSTASGSNGVGLITLTGAETNNSAVAAAFKIASGPKATLMTIYPRNLAVVGSGTLSAGSGGGGTLGTLLGYDVTGCFIRSTGGTGGGGTGGANNQARRIITYNTGTGAFTVSPNWETTPDNTTTYDVLLPESVTLGMLRALNPATAGRTVVVDAAGLVDANTVKVGPTGAGTAQTAGDIPARLPAALTANGNMKSSVLEWITTVFSEGAVGRFATAIQTMFNVTAPVLTVQSVNQTGDTFARVGATGSGLTTLSTAANLTALAGKFTGITLLAEWLGLIAGKQVGNTTARTELRATGAGSGTFDETTDSLEAIEDDGAQLRDFGIMQVTTIATLASQTSFTLTAGSADNNAYIGAKLMVTDQTTEEQKAVGVVAAYTGATKTITLQEDPAIFTMAVGDNVTILAPAHDVFKKRVDGTVTFEQGQRLQNSAAGAKLSGAATTTVALRDLADSKNRIAATVDTDGNRTAVTLDLT